MRVSSKSNSEDRSSWWSHGRKGVRQVQAMEVMPWYWSQGLAWWVEHCSDGGSAAT